MSFETIKFDNKQLEPETDNLEKELIIEKERCEFFDNLLDKIILDTYLKINSGQHGIVGLFDLKQVKKSFEDKARFFLKNNSDNQSRSDGELEKVFTERFGELSENNIAIKILKIFSEKDGDHEVKMQQLAYDIIEKVKEDNPDKEFAKIPRIYFSKAVELMKEPDILKKLKMDDVEIDHKAYLMAMDYYNGDDFAEHIYKKVLESSASLNSEEVDKMSFDQLKKEIEKLKLPGSLSEKSPYNNLSPLQTYRHNNKIIYQKYSDDHGSLDKSIFDKISNTVEALNKNNLYHRDLHERNVFLLKDNGEIRDVCLIDYGMAKEFPSSAKNTDIYRDESREYIRDGYFTFSYSKTSNGENR